MAAHVTKMASPGIVATHHEVARTARPSDVSKPQLELSAGTPMPMKLNADSSRIIRAASVVASVVIIPMTLGIICLSNTHRAEPPIDNAARI